MEKEGCDARIVHHQLVKKAKENDFQEEGLKRLVLFCKVLAEPARLRMLHALLHQEMCVCDLAAFLGNTESSVSHQLRTLRASGIVDNRRDGTVVYYRIIDEQLESFLRNACQQFHSGV